MIKQTESAYLKGIVGEWGTRGSWESQRSGQAVRLSARCRVLVVVILLTAVAWLWLGAAAWSDPGDLLWEAQVDVGVFDTTTSDALAAAGDRVFVGGAVVGISFDDGDWLVRSYDTKTGTLRWDDRFDFAAGDDNLLGITAGDGKVFASGRATTAAGISVPFIRAYDGRTGALRWQDDAGGRQGLFDSAVVHNGRVFAIGALGEDPAPAPGASFFFRSDWLVRAYDARTGSLLWEERFGVPDPVGAVQVDRPVTVAAADNRVFVGGRAHTGPRQPSRWFVRAYDAKTGKLLWQDQAARFSQANSLAVAGDRLVAVGRLDTHQSPPINEDWLIRVYNARTGELLWQEIVDKGVSESEVALDVAVNEGRVFVAGSGGATCRFGVTPPDNCDALLRAYDLKSGQFLWEDRFDEATEDAFFSVAAQDNRVYVTGFGAKICDESGPTICDMIVRAYEADTGRLVWEDRVDKAGTDDIGNSVAVFGSRVFVAGFFALNNTNSAFDILVRAYDARRE